jgi:hypothetical protein
MHRNEHMTENGANGICVAALWLAWTTPGELGEYLRTVLKDEGRLCLFLTEYTIHGRRAINGRIAWFPPDAPWEQMIAAIGTGLSQEEIARRLAPH